jgi:hypothetical protein
LAGPGQRAPPVHARRKITRRGRGQSGHGGEPTIDSTPTEVSNKMRGNGHWTLASLSIQENLGGEAGKGVLTRVELDSAAELGIEVDMCPPTARHR